MIGITVDGVSLDTLAWGVRTRTGLHTTPGLRGSDTPVPGRHGALWRPDKFHEPAELTLSMWVAGCLPDGTVPSDEARLTLYRANLDALHRLFTTRQRLLDLRVDYGPPVGERQAFAQVTGKIEPEQLDPYTARFNVSLSVPGAFWQDAADSEYASPAGVTGGAELPLEVFAGATAPLDELVYVVSGPATNPRLTDAVTGQWVQLAAALADGEDWQVDARYWTSTTGPGLGFGTGGSNRAGVTTHGGPGTRLLELEPGEGGPVLRLSASGTGATTRVLVRGRRKYLS
ncbi:hypothetical protein [Allostreptomyces psammosilenae]|uniref:Uncharacterized protein n=1 Tax=Allostreptomyces psammosilenae TaxID=1892865 RepID=A0A852ZS89_9ACTN|nr:hypothetical protein [Allostreptomyces psammosilenae]NYI05253.1 hypothetical protein [Allostreptomyces psammosilenae]